MVSSYFPILGLFLPSSVRRTCAKCFYTHIWQRLLEQSCVSRKGFHAAGCFKRIEEMSFSCKAESHKAYLCFHSKKKAASSVNNIEATHAAWLNAYHCESQRVFSYHPILALTTTETSSGTCIHLNLQTPLMKLKIVHYYSAVFSTFQLFFRIHGQVSSHLPRASQCKISQLLDVKKASPLLRSLSFMARKVGKIVFDLSCPVAHL